MNLSQNPTIKSTSYFQIIFTLFLNASLGAHHMKMRFYSHANQTRFVH